MDGVSCYLVGSRRVHLNSAGWGGGAYLGAGLTPALLSFRWALNPPPYSPSAPPFVYFTSSRIFSFLSTLREVQVEEDPDRPNPRAARRK